MLTALTVIRNIGYIQCVLSILVDRNWGTDVVIFAEDPHEFNIPVITIGQEALDKSISSNSLDGKALITNTNIFLSTDQEMSWRNIKNILRLKRDAIFMNVSSGDISVGVFRRYEIRKALLGSCENFTDLNKSIASWSNSQNLWNYPSANVCYTYDPPFTMNHGSSNRKGMVLDVHEMIHERIGIKAVFRKTYLLEKGKKRTTDKRLQTLMNGKMCDYFLQGTLGHLENMYDFTTPSFSDTLSWYAPTADLVPKWKYVYQILSRCVWYFWISTLFLLVTLWHFSFTVLKRIFKKHILFRRLWILYKLAVEQDVTLRPSNITEVIIISALILESFIMNVAYKCKFIEFLSEDNYENELNTIEDVMKHGLKIGFLPLLQELFANNEKMQGYLKDHYVLCDFSFACVDRTANSKDMIVLRANTKLSYNFKRYMDDHGKLKLKKIGGIVSAMTINSIFTRGHPLYPVVERELLNLGAHGFVHKIYKDYVKFDRFSTDDTTSNQVLGLKHLRLSFSILLVGWIGSGIIFCCEIIIFRVFMKDVS